MSQVLLDDLDVHARRYRVGPVRVPHPVRAGLRQARGACRIASLQFPGTCGEKHLELIVQRGLAYAS